MKGVNRELSPIIRMTAPSEWSSKPIFEWPTGKVLFSSSILLFGILPIDRHTFFFQSIDRQRGFAEASSSLTNKLWHHRREIEDRKSTRLNSSHVRISYAVFCLKKKKKRQN